MNEDERQLLHIFLSITAMALVEFLGVQLASYVVGIILLSGTMLVHLKLSNFSLGPLEKFVERFERPGVTPGYGAMTIAAGALGIMTLVASKENILASLLILGSGDAMSTIVGRRSRRKLPWSRQKTYGGSIAFFIACLPALYFGGLPAILVAALAAMAESLETNIDDNLVIAIVCVVAFRLLSFA
jgi:dolichol kinase